jgi:hypothetical protein
MDVGDGPDIASILQACPEDASAEQLTRPSLVTMEVNTSDILLEIAPITLTTPPPSIQCSSHVHRDAFSGDTSNELPVARRCKKATFSEVTEEVLGVFLSPSSASDVWTSDRDRAKSSVQAAAMAVQARARFGNMVENRAGYVRTCMLFLSGQLPYMCW